MRKMLRSAERHRTPRARLKGDWCGRSASNATSSPSVAAPRRTLCSELDKRDDELVGGARRR